MKRFFGAVVLVALLILTVAALHTLGTPRDTGISSARAARFGN